MPGHDQLFKDLLRSFFPEFVRLAVPDVAGELGLDQTRFLDKEAFADLPSGSRSEADLLSEVPTRGRRTKLLLIHVEIEGRFRAAMDRRMWRYYLSISLRYGLPVLPILVTLRGGPGGLIERSFSQRVGDREVCRFTYTVFGLEHSVAEKISPEAGALAPALAALMQSQAMSRAEQKIWCLEAVARSWVDDAGRFLLVNVIETYLQLDSEERAEYEGLLQQERHREARSMEMTWADQMQEVGRQAGFRDGLVEGARRVLVSILERRFGPLDRSAVEKIQALADPGDIERLSEEALTAPSATELLGSFPG